MSAGRHGASRCTLRSAARPALQKDTDVTVFVILCLSIVALMTTALWRLDHPRT